MCVVGGDVGSLLSRSTSIYTQLGQSEMLKSSQPMNQPLCLQARARAHAAGILQSINTATETRKHAFFVWFFFPGAPSETEWLVCVCVCVTVSLHVWMFFFLCT